LRLGAGYAREIDKPRSVEELGIQGGLTSTRRRWKASAKNSSETEVTLPPRATEDISVGKVNSTLTMVSIDHHG